jgi:hypothetical protein
MTLILGSTVGNRRRYLDGREDGVCSSYPASQPDDCKGRTADSPGKINVDGLLVGRVIPDNFSGPIGSRALASATC